MKHPRTLTGKNIQLAAALALLVSMAPGCGSQIRNAPLRGSVDLQGHRGARGLRPENSIPAFIYCIEQGMDTIELDTNLTRDGRVIVYHDTELNKKLCLGPDGKAARPLPDIRNFITLHGDAVIHLGVAKEKVVLICPDEDPGQIVPGIFGRDQGDHQDDHALVDDGARFTAHFGNTTDQPPDVGPD